MEKELILKLKKEHEEKLAELLKARDVEINIKIDEYRNQLLNEPESAEILEVRAIIAGLDEMLCPPQVEEAVTAEQSIQEEIPAEKDEPIDDKCYYCQTKDCLNCKETSEEANEEFQQASDEIPCEEPVAEEIPCEVETPVEQTEPEVEPTIEETPVAEEVKEEAPVSKSVDVADIIKEVKPKRDLYNSFKLR